MQDRHNEHVLSHPKLWIDHVNCYETISHGATSPVQN